jgi:hypothetical protein
MNAAFIAGDNVKRIKQHGILVQGETYKVLETNGKYLQFTVDGCTVSALSEGFELVPPEKEEANKPYGWVGDKFISVDAMRAERDVYLEDALVDFARENTESLEKRFPRSRASNSTTDLKDTLVERGNRYGDFADHARLAQALQRAMWSHIVEVCGNEGTPVKIKPWFDKLNNTQRQALTVIADKIARILNGDPNYIDNWHDIQGYAKLVEDRLNKVNPSL